jgi:RNA polymerase sigma-70 factor (ECF subfamily)
MTGRSTLPWIHRTGIAELPERPLEPASQTDQALTAKRVHRALERLPRRERETITLAYWSGLSEGELAAALGVPPGGVKRRTRSALIQLAELLDGEPE